MLENLVHFFKKRNVKEIEGEVKPINKDKNKDQAKERLHLVLMQDRANVSADFLDLMKQEIIDVIKKYIEINETQIDVKLVNQQNPDGTVGSPALYANIPIKTIKQEARKITTPKEDKDAVKVETVKEGEMPSIRPKKKPSAKKKPTNSNTANNANNNKVVKENKEEVKEVKEVKKEEVKDTSNNTSKKPDNKK